MNPIGFIGVGKTGGAMASRVLEGGHEVLVCDASEAAREHLRERGARIAASPAEVAAKCEQISIVVNDDAQVRETVLGAEGVLAGVSESTAAIELAERCGVELSVTRVTHDAMPTTWGIQGGE